MICFRTIEEANGRWDPMLGGMTELTGYRRVRKLWPLELLATQGALRYADPHPSTSPEFLPSMAKPVFYSVLKASGGLFDVVVRIAPDRIVRRDGFLSLAEADEWIEGLRSLMAVLGAPVAQDAREMDEIVVTLDAR